jgi:ABC-type branched-subunit amino acid transport system ATPase component
MNMMFPSIAPNDTQPVLNVVALSKSFGALRVLDDVNLSVAAGDPCACSAPRAQTNRRSCAASTGSSGPTTGAFFSMGSRSASPMAAS